MGLLVTAEIVVGACLVAAILWLASVFVRRRLLERGNDLVLCSVRLDNRARWRSGLLRLGDAALVWLPLLGVTLRPTYGWQRRGIELGSPQSLPQGESFDSGMVRTALEALPQGDGPGCVELALSREGYTALRAWVEAGPPDRRPVDW